MAISISRIAVSALLASAALGASWAGAASVAARAPVVERQVRVSAPLHAQPAAAMHLAPLSEFQAHAPQTAPIKPLPTPAAWVPSRFVPSFDPAWSTANELFPLAEGIGRCALPRSPLVYSVLPSSPFESATCVRDAQAGPDAISLTPGRDKNALYGPSFAPHDFDGP
jgi:hypothetical protein